LVLRPRIAAALETLLTVPQQGDLGLGRRPNERHRKFSVGLVVAPDCRMKYLPRERPFRKLAGMVAGARLVRARLVG